MGGMGDVGTSREERILRWPPVNLGKTFDVLRRGTRNEATLRSL